MPVVPVPPTFEVGLSDTTELNLLRDAANFALNPPIAQLRQGATQTLTTSVAAPINMNVEDVDSAGGHDTVTNNSRYTAQYPGWYAISGGVVFAINATGARYAWWQVNGTDVDGSTGNDAAFAANFIAVHARTMQVYLNVGDYLQLIGFQDSGGNLDTVATAIRHASTMSVRWVSN